MRNKVAKELKREAYKQTVGESEQVSRKVYRLAKKQYKRNKGEL